MLINNHPRFLLRDLFSRHTSSLKKLFNDHEYFLMANARTALFHGVSVLRSEGRNTILMPSYNCGEEVEAVSNAGYFIDFYRIDENCMPDLDDLEKRIDSKSLAIQVTHFNGFPQPIVKIRSICEKYSLYLIEDCAHVLHSSLDGKPLGTFGDISVFSPRKFLPTRNGGVLILNNPRLLSNLSLGSLNKIPLFSELKFFTKLWYQNNFTKELSSARECMTGCYKEISLDNPETHDFSTSAYNYSISPLSEYLLNKFDYNKIRDIRRNNYNYLFKMTTEIEGIRCLQGLTKPDICPLYLLLEVPDPWSLGNYLLQGSIASRVFWNWYHNKFPFREHYCSTSLKQHVLALPIHQDLDFNDMNNIYSSLVKYFQH